MIVFLLSRIALYKYVMLCCYVMLFRIIFGLKNVYRFTKCL